MVITISNLFSELSSALDNSLNKFDIVITTGGLGPTNDDITKEVFCKFFNDKLVHNEDLLVHIENLFKKFVNNPINDLNRALFKSLIGLLTNFLNRFSICTNKSSL